MQHGQGFQSLSLAGQWLLPLAPKEMDSDEEQLEEGNAHTDRILSNVHAAILQGYRGFQLPKASPPSAEPLDLRWNQLQALRAQREQELRKLQGTSKQLEAQEQTYRHTGPVEQCRQLQRRSGELQDTLERLREEEETYVAMLERIRADNEALRTKTKRLKQAFSRIDSQVQNALSVIQIDENWTQSFTQQKHAIQICIDSMRSQRLATLADLYFLCRLAAAEIARKEVTGVKASWISDQIRQIRGKDRKSKLQGQVKHEESVISQTEVMKSTVKGSLQRYQALTELFVQAFGTAEPQAVFSKYHDVMLSNDLLQRNADQMLGAEAKLRREYLHLKQVWYSAMQLEGTEHRPVSCARVAKVWSQRPTDLGEVVYHWMNNIAAMVTRVSRVDTYAELGAHITFPVQVTKPEDDSEAISQAARLCMVLEKKLLAAMEVTQQRTQAKLRKRRANLPSSLTAGDEKLRTRLISEQHFIRNPPADIQALIGSYASTIQKEVSHKQLGLKLPRQPTKTKEEDYVDKEAELWSSGPVSGQTCRLSLPTLDPSIRIVHKEPLTERLQESELRNYVSTRTRELRKSASTEGLVDFMKDLQLRKRDLARFIDKHRKHVRGLSQASESALEGSHKRTVSSLASTCPSVGRNQRPSHSKKIVAK